MLQGVGPLAEPVRYALKRSELWLVIDVTTRVAPAIVAGKIWTPRSLTSPRPFSFFFNSFFFWGGGGLRPSFPTAQVNSKEQQRFRELGTGYVKQQ